MSLFGGVLGFLGGGGNSTSVANTSNTKVDVTVNPTITANIGVDTTPIADAVQKINQQNAALVDKIAQGDQSAAEAVGQGLTNQAQGFAALGAQLQKSTAEIVLAVGALLFISMVRKRA